MSNKEKGGSFQKEIGKYFGICDGTMVKHQNWMICLILMATHSNILAWKIPWMEEPGRLQSMGLQRVGHDWAISLSLSYVSFFLCDSISLLGKDRNKLNDIWTFLTSEILFFLKPFVCFPLKSYSWPVIVDLVWLRQNNWPYGQTHPCDFVEWRIGFDLPSHWILAREPDTP